MALKLTNRLHLIFPFILLTACSEPETVEQKFVGDCASSGTPRSVCSCTYQSLKIKYSDDQLEQFMYMPFPPDAVQKDTLDAVMRCAYQ